MVVLCYARLRGKGHDIGDELMDNERLPSTYLRIIGFLIVVLTVYGFFYTPQWLASILKPMSPCISGPILFGIFVFGLRLLFPGNWSEQWSKQRTARIAKKLGVTPAEGDEVEFGSGFLGGSIFLGGVVLAVWGSVVWSAASLGYLGLILIPVGIYKAIHDLRTPIRIITAAELAEAKRKQKEQEKLASSQPSRSDRTGNSESWRKEWEQGRLDAARRDRNEQERRDRGSGW